MTSQLENASPAVEGAPARDVGLSAEEAAWAEVLRAWDDEARHRTYLARFPDLEGLAVAGWRYREILAARPSDATAVRWRDEVVKRAMVQGLVSLPRTAAPPRAPRTLVRAVVLAFALALGAAAWWVVRALGDLLGARP